MLEARTDREIGDQVGRSTKAVRCKRLNLAIALFAARWRQDEIALLEILIICTSFRGLGDGQVTPIARLHPGWATLPTANIARIGRQRLSRWYVETIVARCDEQLLLGVPIVGARRRQLNFFGRASGRSCRTYPSWDRLLWHSSIRHALSTLRRNARGSFRFHLPIDASVDVTDARIRPRSESI